MTHATGQTLLVRNHEVSFSPREVEILELVAKGDRSVDVAEALFLSKRTVDYHLTHIYEKLGVSNRVQAIIEASRLGLIHPDRASWRLL
jgi:DNA-binding CsgD family transcriptional regulator